jgi:hypothetical protein
MPEPIRVFIGYDPRQPLAYNVLQHSIVRHASRPVSITPLILKQLPIKRQGLTQFTYSRFLVPYLCEFKGHGVFMDADMVVRGDIAELFDGAGMDAVSVMKDQPKFEWASVMLFNCGACRVLTPEFIDNAENKLFDLSWAPYVGALPQEWNHCVGYQEPKESKLYHYTQGLPCWPETRGLPEDGEWLEERNMLTASVTWNDLMGNSVHREPVLRRMLAKYAVTA